MAGIVKKFLASASVVAGMSAVFGAPAVAAPQIQNVYLYDGEAVIYGDDSGYNPWFTDRDGNAGDLDVVDSGYFMNDITDTGRYILQNANHGNIELSGSTDHSYAVGMLPMVQYEVDPDTGEYIVDPDTGEYVVKYEVDPDTGEYIVDPETGEYIPEYAYEPNYSTKLGVEFNDGSNITFRSMTWNDWTGDLNGDGNYYDFFSQWYQQGIMTQGSGLEGFRYAYDFGFDLFTQGIPGIDNGMAQLARISDPNIARVQKKGNGDIFFQLAGHKDFIMDTPFGQLELAFSEVVAVEVDGILQGYAYDFGEPDKLAKVYDNDAQGSHEGLYDFTLKSGGGILAEEVPEPSTVLGLMAIGGLVAATKRKSAK